MTDDDLAARSVAIVIGTVQSVAARRAADRRIVTDYVVRVDSVDSGNIPNSAGSRITVTLPGGSIDDDGQRVFGIPRFIPGDIVQVFLRGPSGMVGTSAIASGDTPGNSGNTNDAGNMHDAGNTKDGDRYAITALGAGIRLLARTADAYTFYTLRSNPEIALRWYTESIDVHIDDRLTDDIDDEATLAAIQASLDEWNKVDCEHPELKNVGLVGGWDAITGSGAGIHATNLIIFQDTARWNENRDDVDQWDLDSTIALATVFHNPNTGQIMSFSIELNDDKFGFAVTGIPAAVDLRNTLTHELGHVLGLDHTGADIEQYWNQTMYYQTQAGETKKRSLGPDDIEGLCALYQTDWTEFVDSGCQAGAGGRTGTGRSPVLPLSTLVTIGLILIIMRVRSRGKQNVRTR